MSQKSKKDTQKEERRTSRRREILNTFGSFIVIPKKGVHRLKLHDISDEGLGFDLDIEGETPADFPLSKGETLEVQLHFNPTLFISLKILVTRIEGTGAVRRVGGTLIQTEKLGPEDQIFTSYLKFIDALEEFN